jgi:hypothetical protein
LPPGERTSITRPRGALWVVPNRMEVCVVLWSLCWPPHVMARYKIPFDGDYRFDGGRLSPAHTLLFELAGKGGGPEAERSNLGTQRCAGVGDGASTGASPGQTTTPSLRPRPPRYSLVFGDFGECSQSVELLVDKFGTLIGEQGYMRRWGTALQRGGVAVATWAMGIRREWAIRTGARWRNLQHVTGAYSEHAKRSGTSNAEARGAMRTAQQAHTAPAALASGATTRPCAGRLVGARA